MDSKDWKKYCVTGGKAVRLKEYPTKAKMAKPDGDMLNLLLSKDRDAIASIQNTLYAENRQSLLIVLQGMDSAGKDSLIKHIMNGVNPQGVMVHSFKHPSTLELAHDYLWRHYTKLPEQGQITLFNRSHYENVLITKVHPELLLAERIPGIERVEDVSKSFWKERYEQINNFEKVVIQNGTQVLKFFLHLSKEEQRKRFLERIEKKEKHWKFAKADITERGYWNDYQKAYEQAIENTSKKYSPWHIIPADDKWYTHLVIGNIIVDKLKQMNPQIPQVSEEDMKLMSKAQKQLESER